MRGKHGINPHLPIAVRIIPARAGQTPSENLTPTCKPDHPRACGANSAGSTNTLIASGSSPRVRGKLQCFLRPVRQLRIIPARAGQTFGNFQHCFRASDHPRACGANWFVVFKQKGLGGSSPRVRGKRLAVSSSRFCPRIIPARAGQTSYPYGDMRANADHPRACGANSVSSVSSMNHLGSSPRVRGKLPPDSPPVVSIRIIPARAGQTRRSAGWPCRRSDHPRACGANRAPSI